jgi:DNA-directed RNA polymerase subunit RPC12/RpoP
MLARCARCQGTFSTDRYGRQSCPHCGAELILPPPPGTPETPEAPPPAEPPRGAAPAGGEPPPPQPGPPAGGFGPAPQPPPGGAWGAPPSPGLPSPFADRARTGFLAGFFHTWKLVATQPESFFARVRPDQAWSAILFGVLASTVGNAMASLYAWLTGQQTLVALEEMIAKMPEDRAQIARIYERALAADALLAQALAAPLVTLVLIYVVAAIVHLLLVLFRGANRGFDATVTAVAYASGLLLLLAVPGCGALLAGVWGLVSLVIGLGAVQRCGSGKAAAAVLAPLVLVCVCCCGALGVSLPAFLERAKSAGTTNL